MLQNIIYEAANWAISFSNTPLGAAAEIAVVLAFFLAIPLYVLSVKIYAKIQDNARRKARQQEIMNRVRQRRNV